MNKGTLTLVPSGGLANRMRAVAAAYALCHATDSRLQVIWFRDWALNAAFEDIFEPIDPSLLSLREAGLLDFVVNDRPRRKNMWLPKWPQKLFYPHRIYEQEITSLRCSEFDFATWLRGNKCYMSCCQMFGTFPNSVYNKLFRPVKEVMECVDYNRSRFSPPYRTIGMHIRRTDNKRSIEKSPTCLFIDAGRKELACCPDLKIFLATDSEDVKSELRAEFGEHLITSESKAFRGNADGIREGLVDMYTLSQTQHIYGSYGSSFSEMAADIGQINGLGGLTILEL